jgi:hypothetical protein
VSISVRRLGFRRRFIFDKIDLSFGAEGLVGFASFEFFEYKKFSGEPFNSTEGFSCRSIHPVSQSSVV